MYFTKIILKYQKLNFFAYNKGCVIILSPNSSQYSHNPSQTIIVFQLSIPFSNHLIDLYSIS